MLSTFAVLNSRLKIKTSQHAESAIFKLHYRATFLFLMGSCLIVTANQYIGDPINCIPDKDSIPVHVINTYCFITSTFTLPKYYDKTIGTDIANWGVGPDTPDDEKKYHNYYMWVPYMLFFQGILFYMPHWIWKAWQGNKIKTLLLGLNIPIMDENKQEEKKKILVKYILDYLHYHNFWAGKYVFCEVLNFANVVGQIYFTNVFLGDEFTTYGPRVVEFFDTDPENRTDPMYEIFPRVTKCTFYKYGPSGTIQIHDSICILALNIINEKIYVFMWFWFVILSILTGLSLIYRLVTIVSTAFRQRLLISIGDFGNKDQMELINRRCQFGDWFLLYSLGRAMDSIIFCDFLRNLATAIKTGNRNGDVEKKKLMA